jgi:hypothetical protein
MSLGQDLFVNLLGHTWGFAKEIGERRQVSRMTPEQLEEWRTEQFAKIHKEAVRLASLMTDKWLHKRGIERADWVRGCEVLLRNDLGVRMSQYLLDGMDIRGLDLRKVRGLNQQQIERAVGDATTQLPDYIHVRSWSGNK